MLSAVCVCLNERPQPRQDHQIGYSRNGNHGARYSHRIVSSTLSHITFSFPSALILYLLYIPAPMPPFPHHTHTFSHISRTRLFSQLYRFFVQLSMLSGSPPKLPNSEIVWSIRRRRERELFVRACAYNTYAHMASSLSKRWEAESQLRREQRTLRRARKYFCTYNDALIDKNASENETSIVCWEAKALYVALLGFYPTFLFCLL